MILKKAIDQNMTVKRTEIQDTHKHKQHTLVAVAGPLNRVNSFKAS